MQNRIGILRVEKGLSLTDLARLAGTTKAQIQKLERGERRLSLQWMSRLARALGVPIAFELFLGTILGHPPGLATWLAGLAAHLVLAGAIALLYGWAFETLSGRADWRVEPGLWVQADPGLVRLVLQNLLGNAWKYTAQREVAVIELCGSGETDSCCSGTWTDWTISRAVVVPRKCLSMFGLSW